MINDKKTLERYNKVMVKYNKYFGDTEQVKRFKLINETWTEANGFLTPTMKLRRRKVMEVYKDEIDNLFR
jgi:long-chain acyl-CoA synthetase